MQLNMFRASSCPSSGATTTAVAASGLLSELGGSSAVGRGRAGRPAGRQYSVWHGGVRYTEEIAAQYTNNQVRQAV